MEKLNRGLVLACLTPRAGKTNHRFIIPTGSKLSEVELLKLGGLAREADNDKDDYIRVGHTVKQFNGRDGDEWLIVAGSSLKNLSSQGREKIRSYLSNKIHQLEIILASFNWDSFPEQTSVQSVELNVWENEASQIVKNETAGKFTKWIWRSLVMTGVLILTIMLFKLNGFRDLNPTKQKGGTPVENIAKYLGMPNEDAKPTEYVLEKVRILFDFSNSKQAGKEIITNQVGDKEKQSQEKELEALLFKIFGLVYGDKVSKPETIRELAANQGFLKELDRLLPLDPISNNRKVDPYALVKAEDGFENLKKSIDPNKIGEFRTVCIGFSRLARAKVKKVPEGQAYIKFYKALDGNRLDAPPKYEGQLFFCPCDIIFLSKLQAIFDKDWFTELPVLSVDERLKDKDTSYRICKFTRQYDDDKKWPFSKEFINDALADKYYSNDKEFLEVLKGLMESLKAFEKQ
jgi:hypothetical protein